MERVVVVDRPVEKTLQQLISIDRMVPVLVEVPVPVSVKVPVERVVPVQVPIEVPVPFPVERIVSDASTLEKIVEVTRVVEVPVETSIELELRKRERAADLQPRDSSGARQQQQQ